MAVIKTGWCKDAMDIFIHGMVRDHLLDAVTWSIRAPQNFWPSAWTSQNNSWKAYLTVEKVYSHKTCPKRISWQVWAWHTGSEVNCYSRARKTFILISSSQTSLYWQSDVNESWEKPTHAMERDGIGYFLLEIRYTAERSLLRRRWRGGGGRWHHE